MNYKDIYEIEHIQNGLTYSQIRSKYKITRGKWDWEIRVKLGLKPDLRKTRCNDDFFDIIDSEIKAYLLGFLYADGCITSDGRISILINRKDIEILHLIQKFVCPNHKIQLRNDLNIKRDPQARLRFLSKRLYNRLVQLGFSVDKTHTESSIFTNIPFHLKHHFIRGFLDGDGSIRWGERSNLTFSKGTKTILEDIDKYLTGGVSLIKKHTTWFTLSYYKRKLVQDVIKMIYDNYTYALKRKEFVALACINTELT